MLYKRLIYALVAAVFLLIIATHFHPEYDVLTKENRATTEIRVTTTSQIPDLKKSEKLLAIPFEKRLQMLGEGLKAAAINETVVIVPINSGMARLMFNLRCSLKDLHVEPIVYFTFDLKVREILSSTLCCCQSFFFSHFLHIHHPLSLFFPPVSQTICQL